MTSTGWLAWVGTVGRGAGSLAAGVVVAVIAGVAGGRIAKWWTGRGNHAVGGSAIDAGSGGPDPVQDHDVAHRLRNVVSALGSAVVRRCPPPWWRGLARRLSAAGTPQPGQLAWAIGVRCLAAGGAVVTALVVLGAAGGGGTATAAALVAGLGVASLPDVVTRRRVNARVAAMRRDLPRHLDLLTISVEAGLGLDPSIDRVVDAIPGALAEEFAHMQAQVRAGMSRAEALRSLVERCPVREVRSFAMAMVQAETLGVAVGPALRSQAAEVRVRHRQAVQMRAQKAPVKMLLPLVVCIFPAVLVVVAGPALLSVRSVFPS